MPIEHYLQNLKRTWEQEPPRKSRSCFYLTPQQRLLIVRELLRPLSPVK